MNRGGKYVAPATSDVTRPCFVTAQSTRTHVTLLNVAGDKKYVPITYVRDIVSKMH